MYIKNLLLECSIRECIEPFNTLQCILYVLLESIDQILAHYASNYAGIFDGGLHTTCNTIIRSHQYKSRVHIIPGPNLNKHRGSVLQSK